MELARHTTVKSFSRTEKELACMISDFLSMFFILF